MGCQVGNFPTSAGPIGCVRRDSSNGQPAKLGQGTILHDTQARARANSPQGHAQCIRLPDDNEHGMPARATPPASTGPPGAQGKPQSLRVRPTSSEHPVPSERGPRRPQNTTTTQPMRLQEITPPTTSRNDSQQPIQPRQGTPPGQYAPSPDNEGDHGLPPTTGSSRSLQVRICTYAPTPAMPTT